MKEISIICLNFKKCNSAQKTAIQRALKGYIDHSNKGTHIYKRKGLLNEIPNSILNKGVIAVESKDKKKIVSILKKNNASCKILNFYTPKKILH